MKRSGAKPTEGLGGSQEFLTAYDAANRELLNQNINVQLYEILKDSGIDYNTIKLMVKHKNIVSSNFKRNEKILAGEKSKMWRIKRHMQVHKDMNQTFKQKLRKYYNSISDNRKTTVSDIGVAELEDPLITLGICKTRSEVEQVLNSFKTHVPGRLTFEEFMSIINGNKMQKRNKHSSTAILEFYRRKSSN